MGHANGMSPNLLKRKKVKIPLRCEEEGKKKMVSAGVKLGCCFFSFFFSNLDKKRRLKQTLWRQEGSNSEFSFLYKS